MGAGRDRSDPGIPPGGEGVGSVSQAAWRKKLIEVALPDGQPDR
jgi:hypothetical protein